MSTDNLERYQNRSLIRVQGRYTLLRGPSWVALGLLTTGSQWLAPAPPSESNAITALKTSVGLDSMQNSPLFGAQWIFDSEGGAGASHWEPVVSKPRATQDGPLNNVYLPCTLIKDRFWYRSRLSVDI